MDCPAIVQCSVRNGTAESNAVDFEFAAMAKSAKQKT
jgi:hypothetical protein